jgi:hypothetical protein
MVTPTNGRVTFFVLVVQIEREKTERNGMVLCVVGLILTVIIQRVLLSMIVYKADFHL